MDLLSEKVKGILESAKEIVGAKIEVQLLRFADALSYSISRSAYQLAAGMVFGIGFLFALIALSLYLESVLIYPGLGFAIVALPFLLIGLMMFVSRKKRMAEKIHANVMKDLIRNLEETPEENPALLSAPKAKTSKKNT